MKNYTIIFNGKAETWIRSDEEMSFNEAQKWVEEKGGVEATVGDLWARDSEIQKPRWLLLKEAGAKGWVWAGEDPEEVVNKKSCYVYLVYLLDGLVDSNGRYSCNYALCRVVF